MRNIILAEGSDRYSGITSAIDLLLPSFSVFDAEKIGEGFDFGKHNTLVIRDRLDLSDAAMHALESDPEAKVVVVYPPLETAVAFFLEESDSIESVIARWSRMTETLLLLKSRYKQQVRLVNATVAALNLGAFLDDICDFLSVKTNGKKLAIHQKEFKSNGLSDRAALFTNKVFKLQEDLHLNSSYLTNTEVHGFAPASANTGFFFDLIVKHAELSGWRGLLRKQLRDTRQQLEKAYGDSVTLQSKTFDERTSAAYKALYTRQLKSTAALSEGLFGENLKLKDDVAELQKPRDRQRVELETFRTQLRRSMLHQDSTIKQLGTVSKEHKRTVEALQKRDAAVVTPNAQNGSAPPQLERSRPRSTDTPPAANPLRRLANRMLQIEKNRHLKLINESDLLDPDWYFEKYPDAKAKGLSAAQHYLKFGRARKLASGPHFSGEHYISSNPDLEQSRINPLVHYLMFGREEGRQIRGDI